MNHGDVMCSVGTTADDAVLCVRKLLRVGLKTSHHKEKNVQVYVAMDVKLDLLRSFHNIY